MPSPNSSSKKSIFSPYDQSEVGVVSFDDIKAAEKKLSIIVNYFQNTHAVLPTHRRIEILEKFIEQLKANKSLLIETAVREGGKPWTDTLAEFERACQGVKAAIATLYAEKGTEIPMSLSAATSGRIAYTMREPIGPVFAISAFNHPINLIIHQVVPAIAVGCPILIKPAKDTPLSCIKLIELLYEVGLPEAFCQVLLCEKEIAEKMVADPRIRYFSFIGSSSVGFHLQKQLAPGVKCTLEHGGVAPVIVEQDADLEFVIPALIKAGFYHAGQVCVSAQRVYLHENIAEHVTSLLKTRAEALLTGNPLLPATEVGPLIRQQEIERIDRWIKEAVQEGAVLITGGMPTDKQCYLPTLLSDPTSISRISNEEIFGPVMGLYTYRDLDDAISRANALPFCFQSAIFTQNLQNALKGIRGLKANTVLVNDHPAFRADWMPFSGSELSGFGTGGIPYSMRDMQSEKLWIIKSPMI